MLVEALRAAGGRWVAAEAAAAADESEAAGLGC